MLVLSRKEGERLVIGDNITLIVSKIAGNRVTVGIEAPADVKIYRGELKDDTKHEPRVVPLRRTATVTIDLEDASPNVDLPGRSEDHSEGRGFGVSELAGRFVVESKAAM
jgi:carbon storage regulator